MNIIGALDGKRYILIVECFCAEWRSLNTGDRFPHSPVWSEDQFQALQWFHDLPNSTVEIVWE